MALLVAEGDGPAAELVEALDGVDEMPEEGVAAHLAVGDHIQPRAGLQRDGLVHGAIFDLLELRVAEVPASCCRRASFR